MSVHEQNDERDMLIASEAASSLSRQSSSSKVQKKFVSAKNNESTSSNSKGLTGWLSTVLATPSSSNRRNHHTNKRTHHHLEAMSSWLYSDSDDTMKKARSSGGHMAATAGDANRGNSEATYDILDDERATTMGCQSIEYSQEENDGFEHVAGGRKSPNYPFYNFYHQTRRGRTCRFLFLTGCLLVLLFLSVAVLIQLIVLIRQQQQLYPYKAWNVERHEVALDKYELEAGVATRWLVSTPKCHIPAIDPWHDSIKGYVKRQEPLNCKQIFKENANKTEPPTSSIPLTYTRDNKLLFTKAAIKMGYLDQKCCMVPLSRKYENDDKLDSDEKCYLISAEDHNQTIAHDLITILCQRQKITGTKIVNETTFVYLETIKSDAVYKNVHSFIVRNLDEEAALDRVSSRRLNQDDHYNVVMVGVDTISRLNGYRQLNQTLAQLRQHYETLEFVGYNKVGENTFPNLIPFLTGLTPEQLTKVECWLASNYSDESEKGDDYLDNCKFLWNFYQELGYITYFSEDWPKASTFNYLKEGFRREPTTFYGRPFTLARDDLLLPPVGMGCSSCLLDRPLVQVDLDNLDNFIRINKDRPHFAFHWVNCPQHDDLNGASMVDSVFEEFFAKLKSITHDDRTFVIFFSDHGYRWNDFVSTRVGHYESSLPLLTIAPPKKFIQKHPDLYENLKRHQSSLLTPFDMFKTLIAIRNLAKRDETIVLPKEKQSPSQTSVDKTTSPPTTSNPLMFEDPQYTSGPTAATTIKQITLLDGVSFRQSFETVSLLDAPDSTRLDRSCIGAGIPDNYCVCHAFEETPTNSNNVLGAAYYLTYVHLYARLKDHKDQCYLLDLEKIHKAELFDFKQMKSAQQTTTTTARPKRRRSITAAANPSTNRTITATTTITTAADTKVSLTLVTTTPSPRSEDTSPLAAEEEEVIDEQRYLPSREYNIRISTKPGGGLFQEVVRYYGQDDMKECEMAVNEAKVSIEGFGEGQEFGKKHESVLKMNEICKFSVHSDSISRLNLYRDQSKCVKSNIELKKICYCLDLPS